MVRSIFLMALVAVWAAAIAAGPTGAVDLPATQTTQDLIRAAAAGDGPRVAALLQAGADPNVVDETWTVPLHHAARLGRLDLARMLVRAGARLDWQDVAGVSALILAAAGNHFPVAEYLIWAGADPMVEDVKGRRALDYALKRGKNDGLARMLRRAEINRPTKKSKTGT